MPTEHPNSADTLYGVDKDVFDRFIDLFRDKYRIVDAATNFLENKAGVQSTNITITNQRDAVSHFSTLLSGDMTVELQWSQLHSAEEHLRRAIAEPYEIGVTHKLNGILDMMEDYKESVLTLSHKPELRAAPSYDSVTSTLQKVSDLRTKGRKAKSIRL